MKNKILLHHSGVSRSTRYSQFDAIKSFHVSKGWGNIGYHYIIEPDGTLKNGRDEELIGAHCNAGTFNNYNSIGVCIVGNFEVESPTDAQREALKRFLSQQKKEKGDISISEHRLQKATLCPGKSFFPLEVVRSWVSDDYKTGEEALTNEEKELIVKILKKLA